MVADSLVLRLGSQADSLVLRLGLQQQQQRVKGTVLIVCIGSVCYIIKALLRSRRHRATCPHIAGHWLFGVLPELMAGVKSYSMQTIYHNWHELHGDTFTIAVPGEHPHGINTRNPKNIEHILKTNFDNYPKGDEVHTRLEDLLGNGIFNTDGKLWFDQRKTSSRLFTQSQFKNHIWRVVEKNCSEMVRLLQQVPKGEAVDVFNVMNRFTLDTIGQVGFSRKIGSLQNPDSPFLKSFDSAQQICALRFALPFWWIRKILRIGGEKDSRHHFKLLADYSLETVRMLKDNLHTDDGESFVGLFMREAQNRGEAIDEKFMKDMVLNFLIAGRDTTAQSLSWTFYLLTGQPDVERKILEEVKHVLAERGVDETGELTYDDLNKLTYLQCVISEGLRLFPSVPVDPKQALEDDVLPDGTFVPKGSRVTYNIYSLGRCKQMWGEDAAEFRPERWLNSGPINPYEFPVFNAGPRECLGKRLAYVEMKACLVAVLRSFRLELAVARDEIRPDLQLTLGMSSGLPCRIHTRESKDL